MSAQFEEEPTRMLCISIGEDEIARFRGETKAISRASRDVLQDVILAVLWRRHHNNPDVVETLRLIEASLRQRSDA